MCGINLSASHKNIAPPKNPIAATNHAGNDEFSAISIAGANKDQKLAAIITPAANPSIVLRTRWLISLKKNTIAAPSAVSAQVIRVANSANNT